MFGPSWRKHFALSELRINHEDPIVFIVSQWQRDKATPSLWYLALRLALALTFFITWVLTLSTNEDPARWAIYLTTWGYTVCTLQAVLAAGMLLIACSSTTFGKPKTLRTALAAHPVYWVVNTIATPLAFGITVIYWSVLYKSNGEPVPVLNVFVHALNSVLMFCDLWVVCHPVRILHFVYPLALGLTYTVFSVIYYSAGGTGRDSTPYIYPIVNWEEPGKTILICFGIILFVVILHVCTYFIYKGRVLVAKRVFGQDEPGPKRESNGYDNAAMATENV